MNIRRVLSVSDYNNFSTLKTYLRRISAVRCMYIHALHLCTRYGHRDRYKLRDLSSGLHEDAGFANQKKKKEKHGLMSMERTLSRREWKVGSDPMRR